MQIGRQGSDRFWRRSQEYSQNSTREEHTAMDRRALSAVSKTGHQIRVRQNSGSRTVVESMFALPICAPNRRWNYRYEVSR